MSLLVDIHKQMGDFTLDVSFDTGDLVTGLLGASGCGKSMTLQCIAGVQTPDSGRIVLDGETLFDSARGINLPPQKRRVGYLFQHYALFPHMTVAKNIAYVPSISGGWSREESQRQVAELLTTVGLDPALAGRYPHELSGGQKQRVGIARALAAHPPILLMDEPFGAVDEITRRTLQKEILQLQQKLGLTVIFVTHDIKEALGLGSRVLVMEAGRISQLDTPAAIQAAPANDFVRALIFGQETI